MTQAPTKTASEALDDKAVKALQPPAAGNRITYDGEVKGFGVRVTSAGAKAFILNYRAGGRERRITIGSHPDWKVAAARDQAKALKRRIDLGEDPMGDRHADRAAPDMNALADRFIEEHLGKRRAATQSDYKTIIRLYIRPTLGKVRVADVTHADVERLHNRISKAHPYQANRMVAVLGKMLALAVKWQMRTDNPARGIEQAPEHKRERFLTTTEIAKVGAAIAELQEETSANAIRLLLLTGARKGETLKARWSEFDLKEGVWVKPSAHTKTKKVHRIPLSAPARVLLAEMWAKAEEKAKDKKKSREEPPEFVFEGDPGKSLGDIKRSWATVCRKAGLGNFVDERNAAGKVEKVWKADARVHDLRHTYASVLASHGLSLPIIGQLLGHTQSQTTHRYAHLLDDPLRAATERVGAVVSGRKHAELLPFTKAAG